MAAKNFPGTMRWRGSSRREVGAAPLLKPWCWLWGAPGGPLIVHLKQEQQSEPNEQKLGHHASTCGVLATRCREQPDRERSDMASSTHASRVPLPSDG